MKADFTNIRMLPNQDISIRLTSAHKQTVKMNWDVGEEIHTSFEILKVIDGEQISYINEDKIRLKKDDIIILPPKLLHHNICKNEAGLTYFCIHFHIDEPTLNYALVNSLPLIIKKDFKNYDQINAVIAQWINLLDKESPFDLIDSLKTQTIFTELLIVLSTLFIAEKKSTNSLGFFYASELAQTIKRNFREYSTSQGFRDKNKLSINSMIKEIGISQNHAINVFKEVYGISPKKYLDDLKYQEAKLLLQYPFSSIEQIADRIGYSTSSHFSRQFKLWSGHSPLQYRKLKSTDL
ncbi:AraC family transcriptional regulator [Enterococcus sp. LJL120]